MNNGYRLVLRRFFSENSKERFLKRLSEAPASKHPRFVSDNDKNSSMSVLLPLVTVNGRDSILLTKRSIHLRSHRGELCFPGGRKEPGETPEKTALRETFEEIGLEENDIEIWGSLKSIIRRQADFVVTPIVGFIKNEKTLDRLNVHDGEVQAVFTVPLDELIQTATFTKFASPTFRYVLPAFDSSQFTVQYNTKNEYLHRNQRIWGLSAIMLHQALIHLKPDDYKHDLVIKFF